MIHTILGSCVSVVFFDRQGRYGAMCHAVLDSRPAHKSERDCYKYMDCVLTEMVCRFAEVGVDANSLAVKIFGGAQMTGEGRGGLQPGEKNIRMARMMLEDYNCRIESEDCGGMQGRKIYFYSHTGDVFLKRIRKTAYAEIIKSGRKKWE